MVDKTIRKKSTKSGTHEPVNSLAGWPKSHVNVQLVLDTSVNECVLLTVHEQLHYLHATTARELQRMLEDELARYNRDVDTANEKYGTRIPYV